MLKLLRNPWIILGCITAVSTAYFYGHHVGYVLRDLEMQSEIAAKNEEAREREHKLNEQLTQTTTELKDANDAINQKQSALDRAIRSGRVRLPAASCVQADAGTTAPSVDRVETTSDAYNAVREQVNGPR
jgi:hypothetical protein